MSDINRNLSECNVWHKSQMIAIKIAGMRVQLNQFIARLNITELFPVSPSPYSACLSVIVVVVVTKWLWISSAQTLRDRPPLTTGRNNSLTLAIIHSIIIYGNNNLCSLNTYLFHRPINNITSDTLSQSQIVLCFLLSFNGIYGEPCR